MTSSLWDEDRFGDTSTDELVSMSGEGHPAAMSVLIRRYYPHVRSTVKRRMSRELRSIADSADVAQDVVIETVRSIKDFRPGRAKFSSWLCAIVENRLRNLSRYGRRHPLELRAEPLPDECDTEARRRARIAEEVDLAMERLPPHYSAVLRLRHVDRYTFGRIGEMLGKTEGAAWMLHDRALAELVRVFHELRRRE